jgi:hypothetical protein
MDPLWHPWCQSELEGPFLSCVLREKSIPVTSELFTCLDLPASIHQPVSTSGLQAEGAALCVDTISLTSVWWLSIFQVRRIRNFSKVTLQISEDYLDSRA